MIKSKTLLLIIILLANTHVLAQFNFSTLDARSNAMGGCYTSLNDFGSNIANIAGAAFITNTHIGIHYKQNYIMKGHSIKSLAAIFPTKKIGSFITNYSHYGNLNYNEQILSAGYSLQLSSKFALGVLLHYLHSGISDHYYTDIDILTFSIGIIFRPSTNISFGAKIYNPIYAPIPSLINSHIPIIFNIGLSYQMLNNLLGCLEIEKDNLHPIITRIGLEYRIIKNLFTRIGFSTHPNIFRFGIGLKQRKYSIDISTEVHQTLGLTPQISTNFSF